MIEPKDADELLRQLQRPFFNLQMALPGERLYWEADVYHPWYASSKTRAENARQEIADTINNFVYDKQWGTVT